MFEDNKELFDPTVQFQMSNTIKQYRKQLGDLRG
jgi:hypothetical protein